MASGARDTDLWETLQEKGFTPLTLGLIGILVLLILGLAWSLAVTRASSSPPPAPPPVDTSAGVVPPGFGNEPPGFGNAPGSEASSNMPAPGEGGFITDPSQDPTNPGGSADAGLDTSVRGSTSVGGRRPGESW